MSNKRITVDVLRGILDPTVLQTLNSLGPLHGYAVAARLEGEIVCASFSNGCTVCGTRCTHADRTATWNKSFIFT